MAACKSSKGARKRGRGPGFKPEERLAIVKLFRDRITKDYKPTRTAEEWEEFAQEFGDLHPTFPVRSAISYSKQFHKIRNTSIPTGDPTCPRECDIAIRAYHAQYDFLQQMLQDRMGSQYSSTSDGGDGSDDDDDSDARVAQIEQARRRANAPPMSTARPAAGAGAGSGAGGAGAAEHEDDDEDERGEQQRQAQKESKENIPRGENEATIQDEDGDDQELFDDQGMDFLDYGTEDEAGDHESLDRMDSAGSKRRRSTNQGTDDTSSKSKKNKKSKRKKHEAQTKAAKVFDYAGGTGLRTKQEIGRAGREGASSVRTSASLVDELDMLNRNNRAEDSIVQLMRMFTDHIREEAWRRNIEAQREAQRRDEEAQRRYNVMAQMQTQMMSMVMTLVNRLLPPPLPGLQSPPQPAHQLATAHARR